MALPSIFNEQARQGLVDRINALKEDSAPIWGKMEVAQMLAHLNVMFELGLENKHDRPNAFVRFILRALVKPKLVNEKPYKKNSATAPEMVIDYYPDFQRQRKRTVDYLTATGSYGQEFFDKRAHPSFSRLSSREWSNLFYKHIDHHLQQFGV
ncbi:MAG: DUF1569 domain-containing protein [Bacteroidota bacterium]